MRNARLTLPFALAAALTCCGYPDEFAVADGARASAEGGPEAGTPDVAPDAADDRADGGPEADADLADVASPDAAPEPGPEAGPASPDAGPDVTPDAADAAGLGEAPDARDAGFEAGQDVSGADVDAGLAEAGRDGPVAPDAADAGPEAAVERCSAAACGACLAEAGCGWCGYYERCQRSGVGVCPGGWRAVGVAACGE